MKSQSRLVLAASIAVGLGLAPAPEAVAADDAMMELIEILYQKGSIDQAEYDALMKAANEEAESEQTIKKHVEEAPKVSTAKGLTIGSQDGSSSWDFSGRVQMDAATYGDETDDNGNDVPLSEFGQEARRVWLSFRGKMYDHWGLRIQYDFSGNSLKDGWISYSGLPGKTTLKIGQFKEPISISQQTGNGNLTFLERPTPVNGQLPFRNVGVQVGTKFDKGTLTAGFFGQGLDSGGGDEQASIAFTARGTYAPIHSNRKLLHFGTAFTVRDAGDRQSFRFRDRPESHITNTRLVDTGNIAGADGLFSANIEAAGVYNRFAWQGEYVMTSVDRSEALGGDLDFNGYYVVGSFFLTDDSRRYNMGAGKWRSVSPSKPVSQGGGGAWQVGFRYSDTDFIDGNIDGGDQQIASAVLNWYPESNLRFSINYNKVVGHEGGNFPGAEPGALTARAQITW
jgi:phosphate-selective porin OprO/OprP